MVDYVLYTVRNAPWMHLDGSKDTPGTILLQPTNILSAVMSHNKATDWKIKDKREHHRREWVVYQKDTVRSTEKRRRTVTREET